MSLFLLATLPLASVSPDCLAVVNVGRQTPCLPCMMMVTTRIICLGRHVYGWRIILVMMMGLGQWKVWLERCYNCPTTTHDPS